MIHVRSRNISNFKGMEPWQGRLNDKKIELLQKELNNIEMDLLLQKRRIMFYFLTT